jgi:hypothetical protein
VTEALRVVREAVMSHASTRAIAESLVQGILEEISDLDDDELGLEYIAGVRLEGVAPMSVAELRGRLRETLEEIAARDSPVRRA